MKKVSFLSLGCKVNRSEISVIERALKRNGYESANLNDNPDVCIINTCSVTSKSDYESRQLIRKAVSTGAKVIVTGCYSQLNKETVLQMPGVSEVIDNSKKLTIINKFIDNTEDLTLRFSTVRKRAFIKIQDGCNADCSYCIIPKARGRSRSIGLNKVITQINEAHNDGFKEIVLTGIHLGLYGLDIADPITLSDLLEAVLTQTMIQRIRISSLEINEIDDRFLDLMKDDRICNHLHIPIQSGDDNILKLMNRHYNTSEYEKKLNHIVKNLPEVNVGTDIIVGFPYESEREFDNSLNLLVKLPFNYLHVFRYSKRPGTIASQMPESLDSAVIKDRALKLRRLSESKRQDYARRNIGKTLKVLVEENKEIGWYSGNSDNYLRIDILASSLGIGTVVEARVLSAESGKVIGEPLYCR